MDAMVLLEGDAMVRVYHEFKRIFEEEDRGLSLLEFISAFINNVDFLHMEKKAIIKMLVDLFRHIDVNGDEALEWTEFMSFCVEAGLASGLSNIQRPTFYLLQDPHFEDVYTKITGVQEIRYHEMTDMIMSIEHASKGIRFYDGRLRLLRQLNTETCIRAEFREVDTSVPLRCVIMDDLKAIAVLMSNLNVAMWRIGVRAFFYTGTIKREGLDHTPCMLHYDSVCKLLLIGYKDGVVRAFNPVTRNLVFTLKQHSDIVLSMASIPHRSWLATTSMDGKVLLWDADAARQKCVREMAGHTATAEKLLVAPALDLLLGLCVNGEIVGWDMTVCEVVMTFGLEHPGHVKDMALIPTMPQRLVSVCSTPVMKMWEIALPTRGKCPCLATLPLDTLTGHPVRSCIFTVPRRLRKSPVTSWMAEYVDAPPAEGEVGGFVGDLILAAPKLNRITSLPIDVTDIPVATLYNKTMTTFISVMSRDLLVWDVDTGKRTAAFCIATHGQDLTSAAFDDRQRKLLVGRSDGIVLAINLLNGSEMKRGDSFGPVSKVLYHSSARCVVTTTTTGALVIFDDEPQQRLESIRWVKKAHPHAITALAMSEELCFIATGDSSGTIRCWDFQDLRCLMNIKYNEVSVTSLLCFGAMPMLLGSHADGQLTLWSCVRGFPWQLFYECSNIHIIREAYSKSALAASSEAHQMAAFNEISAQRRQHRKEAPFALNESAQRAALDTLDSNIRLGALVDQIIHDRTVARHGAAPLGASAAAGRKFKLSYVLEDEEEIQRQLEYKLADIEIREVETAVAITSTCLGQEALSSKVVIVTADDLGYVRVADLTSVANRAGMTLLSESKWPSSLASYDPRRIAKRIDPMVETAQTVAGDWKDMDVEQHKARTPSRSSKNSRLPSANRHRVAEHTILDTVNAAAYASAQHEELLGRTSTYKTATKRKLSVFQALEDDLQVKLEIRAHFQAVSNVSIFDLPVGIDDPKAQVYIASCGCDGRIFLWSYATGAIQGQIGMIPTDEDLVATGQLEKTTWTMPAQSPITRLGKDREAEKMLKEVRSPVRQAHPGEDEAFEATKADSPMARQVENVPVVTSEEWLAHKTAIDRQTRLAETMHPAKRLQSVRDMCASWQLENMQEILMQRENNMSEQVTLVNLLTEPIVDLSQMLPEDELIVEDENALLKSLNFEIAAGKMQLVASTAPPRAMLRVGDDGKMEITRENVQTILKAGVPVTAASSSFGPAAATVLAMSGYDFKDLDGEKDIAKTVNALGWGSGREVDPAVLQSEGGLPRILDIETAMKLVAVHGAEKRTVPKTIAKIKAYNKNLTVERSRSHAIQSSESKIQASIRPSELLAGEAEQPEGEQAPAEPDAHVLPAGESLPMEAHEDEALTKLTAAFSKVSAVVKIANIPTKVSGVTPKKTRPASSASKVSSVATSAADAAYQYLKRPINKLPHPGARPSLSKISQAVTKVGAVRRFANGTRQESPPLFAALKPSQFALARCSHLDDVIGDDAVDRAAAEGLFQPKSVDMTQFGEEGPVKAKVALHDIKGGKRKWHALKQAQTAAMHLLFGALERDGRRMSVTKQVAATDIPLPGPGVAIPATFGPYQAMYVMQVRNIFDDCDTDKNGDAEVDLLRAHAAWQQLEKNPEFVKSRLLLKARTEVRLSLKEFFDIIFKKVHPEMRAAIIMWTDPETLAGMDTTAEVNWREVLSEGMVASFRAIFEALDADGSGSVSVAEIEDWFSSRESGGSNDLSMGDILDIVHEHSADPESELNVEEFLKLMAAAMMSNHKINYTRRPTK